MILSKNFTLEELIASPTATELGIDNKPGERETASLRNLCEQVLQPLRDRLGKSIAINSGYRCPALNKAVGGVDTSQHVKGEAADIRVDGIQARELFNHVRDSGMEFDQLILYPTFVHVSFSKGRNRKQVLYAKGVTP
jgi:uncharacterized protein YcbK (DUF882 family)